MLCHSLASRESRFHIQYPGVDLQRLYSKIPSVDWDVSHGWAVLPIPEQGLNLIAIRPLLKTV